MKSDRVSVRSTVSVFTDDLVAKQLQTAGGDLLGKSLHVWLKILKGKTKKKTVIYWL